MASVESLPASKKTPGSTARSTAFGCPRDFFDNRFVYAVISPRARGLSVGVNMNPDKVCNFDCGYCEVNRVVPPRDTVLDVNVMAEELERTLAMIQAGGLRNRPNYTAMTEELLRLKHVTLSGDGEPTLCPNFFEAVEAVVHIRAKGKVPFFKLVLITNASGLDRPEVKEALSYFTQRDEVWAKLEAGTQSYMDKVNKAQVPLTRILENIREFGRQRPVVIQSLFPSLYGHAPAREEVEQFAHRLLELKNQGTQISLVQIYSATRPTPHSECSHLPLKTLSLIAQTVRQSTGLKVEVF